MTVEQALAEASTLKDETQFLKRILDRKVGAHDRAPVSLHAELQTMLDTKEKRLAAVGRALASTSINL